MTERIQNEVAPRHGMRLVAAPSNDLKGTAVVPGDKSISHRALIFGALSIGKTEITGLSRGEDVIATAEALIDLGVQIDGLDDYVRGACNTVSVYGQGVSGLKEPTRPLDLGNSGTGVRLLMGVAGQHDFPSIFTGDESLSGRPMGRVAKPLRAMGISVEGREGDLLPMRVVGPPDLMPIVYEMPVASAQVKSAILLAALAAPGITEIIEPSPSRDHSERMARYFGADVKTSLGDDGRPHILVRGEIELQAADINVPTDPSAAAFPIVAALISNAGSVCVPNVCVNKTRTGLFEVLQSMGGDIRFEDERDQGGEAVADIFATSSHLEGVDVPTEVAPRMIDEYPILAVAAAFASGRTHMPGIAELRVKESDRIAKMVEGLTLSGVKAVAGDDFMTVEGARGGVAGGVTIDSALDHRIAMSFAVLGLGSQAPIELTGAAAVRSSFPGFAALMRTLGADITERE
ncbi:MAG: 3-phosphoshikimate 1-carboxyvinyltransferase [Pseudomonadota bacterium]